MVSALLVATCLMAAQDEEKNPTDLGPEVRKLVRQLRDDELAVRDAAEKALTDLGTEVLSYLPRVDDRTPAEIKVRLGRITKALETKFAAEVTRPTTVSLEGEMTLGDALEAIEKQTGNRVEGVENRDPKVRMDFLQTTYWEAMDQILDRVGLTLNPYGGAANALSVVDRPEGQLERHGRAAYSSLFRFEITRLESARDLRRTDMGSLQLALEVSWEPRMTPIVISQALADIQAVDENGNTLSSADDGARELQGQKDAFSGELGLPLRLPDRSVKKIASFKGKLTALVPGRVETFEFVDLPQLNQEELSRGGVTVTVDRFRKTNEDVFELRVRVRFDEASNALESHRGWLYNNEANLVDKTGQQVPAATTETFLQEDNEVGIAYYYAIEDAPETYKFVYRTPASIVPLEVEYELKDIELP